ncbi:MAG TPA: HD domain-containing protein, partial [Blastocatellia bacterium]|nr:HD domain-containing protein [Blastocatellia bacterium]
IAAQAHLGQRDKGGAPYILHPLRMMMRMESEAAMIAAALHDVVEDSAWTLEQLRDEGFSEEVLQAVDCLTRRDGETYDEFVARAGANAIARPVKIADLEDNMNVKRLGEMTPKDLARIEEYHRAWRALTQES